MADKRGGGAGALLLHGFTGVPASMQPLGDAFAARAGFTVAAPLLPGHGTTPEDLDRSSYAQWLAASVAAYRPLAERCGQVIVAGLSMGGALSCEIALSEPGVLGLILVNPFIEPPDPSFFELLEAALAAGSTRIPSIGSDISKPGVSGGGYATTPIRPLLSLARGTEELAPRLVGITVPLLLASSRVDHVVPTRSSDFLARNVSGPVERVYLEHSYHVATLDHDGPELCRRAVEFAEKLRTP